MRRVRTLWKALRAWLAAKRRRKPVVTAPAAEVKNPLRLDDTEYLEVMKELDEVLGSKPATTTEKPSL